MKLAQAAQLATLQRPEARTQPLECSALGIARRVFALAAAAGHPYRSTTAKRWAEEWLASDRFVLMRVPLHFAALPAEPRNPELVQMLAGADVQEPIVIDVNRQGVGQAPNGFVPSIIVVDGKHRHRAARLQGHSYVQAWVGNQALDKLEIRAQLANTVLAPDKPMNQTAMTRVETAAVLNNVPQQSRAANNSAPSGGLPGVKARRIMKREDGTYDAKVRVYSQGAPTSLSQGSGPAMMPANVGVNPNRVGAGAVPQDPSDEAHDPSDQAPGAGGGKRLAPDKGASNSELQEMRFGKLNAGPVHIRKIITDFKAACKAGYKPQLQAKAPEGWEGTVKKMKEHPDIDNPWALANWMKDEGYQPGGSKKK